MSGIFDADRLGKEIVVKDGRSQFLITGKIEDYFFPDITIGVCHGIEMALNFFGLVHHYDMVMVIDMNDAQHPLRFSPPEMKELYDAIVSGRTPQPNDNGFVSEDEIDVAAENRASGSENQNPNRDAAMAQVAAASVKSLTLEFDRILNRLIPDAHKSLVIVKNAEKILQYAPTGGLTGESRHQLETIRGWAKLSKRGHPNTATILIIDEAHFERFEGFSSEFVGGLEMLTKTVVIGSPDRHEIESLLIRLQGRYGLLGNARLVAEKVYAQVLKNNDGLLNVVANVEKKMTGSPKPISLDDLFEDKDAENRRKALAEAEQELASMIGLTAAKQKVEELRFFAERLRRQREAGEKPSNRALHSLLLGNPGTGKTVVARILGKLYYGLGIRQNANFVEISAADVSSGYNPGDVSEKLSAKLSEATGGVLFIDEIYQFGENSWLREAFQNVLMKYMEDHRDKITVLGAGYEEKLPEILKINPGVPTRFSHPDNTIIFPDYTENELLQITELMIKDEKRILTPEAREKLFDYIKSREQLGGIGNGRGVRNLVEQITGIADKMRQYREIDEDVIPDPVRVNPDNARKILGEMNEKLMGLGGLKKHLEMLLITQEDKLHRKHFDHSTQHMALLGNPGTGKTTAVSFMARFFHAVGITSRANVVLCDVARDFSDSRHVRDKFDEALGGVLFIDEAYRLAGTESLHQVVQIMTEDNYRDLVVIIAGYTDKMQDVFRDNPGISDRFKKQIRFENFTDGELEEIFMHSLRASNFHVPEDETESFRRSLYREFKKLRNDPHFANARTIKKFYEEVSSRRAIRCANDPNADRFSIVMDDLRSPIDKKENLDDILDELDRNFIGLQSVKNQIRDFALLVEDHVRDGSPLEKQMFNMQFRGNPGTGKTTIARYMARIYNALELIEGTEVIEMAALSLKGSYIGHSKDHVKKAFEDARTQHKLLFLDEAYALYPRMDHGTDSFAAEVIAMIVSEDTARYNENVFTILAGYTEDMEYLMKGNAGFSRRFCTIINFPDYTVEECIAILRNNLHKRNLQFDQDQLPAIERRLRIIIEDMQREPHFGNAGAMVTLGQQIIINLRKRDRSSSIITPVDLDNL